MSKSRRRLPADLDERLPKENKRKKIEERLEKQWEHLIEITRNKRIPDILEEYDEVE